VKNYISEGKTLTLVAPVGGVTSGTPVIIGGVFCVPMSSADAGASFVGLVCGTVGLVKASGTTAAAGAALYFNATSGLIETSDSASNRRIGVAAEALVSGSTEARVRLDGVSFGASNIDLEAKMDKADLASTDNGKGASLVGIEDAGTLYTADTVEGALAEIRPLVDAAAVAADIASTDNGKGASLIGIEDAGSLITATDTEGALQELAQFQADLGDDATGKGASQIAIEDADGHFDATDVEGALAEIVAAVSHVEGETKDVVIPLGQASGSSIADDDWIGATLTGCFALSGNDQVLSGVAIDGSGVVTVTVGGNETAAATFRVVAVLA